MILDKQVSLTNDNVGEFALNDIAGQALRNVAVRGQVHEELLLGVK